MQSRYLPSALLLFLLFVGAGAWTVIDRPIWADSDHAPPAQAASTQTVQTAPVQLAQTDSVQEREAPPELDVPYVPTDQKVVDEMLRITGVKKGDVVYDLGCGDGRIVVTAAKKYGATGVGVDIDPQRIRESKENARKAGVTDKVKFEVKDLFTMSVKPATVMTMYLLPSVNLKLRPRLFEELRPGARLVSHDFTMGNWQPDKTVVVDGAYRQHTLYYWVMPANAAGQWTLTLPKSMGGGKGALQLDQTFQNASGNLRIGNRSIPVAMAKLNGTQLSFGTIDTVNGKSVPMSFVGVIRGNNLEGSLTSGSTVKHTVSGKRTKAGKINQPTIGESRD